MRRLLPLLCVALSACHPVPMGAPVPTGHMIVCAANDDCRAGPDVEITYLGVAGFMIRSGNNVLLTAPHFSTPSLLRATPYKFWQGPVIAPDTARIRHLLPDAARRTSAILVGHGHYDHLLDVPFIADSLATNAIVYGGPTVRNMLAGDHGLRPRLVAVAGDSVGDVSRVGTWLTTKDGAFRVMALKSSHAPAVNDWLLRYDYAPGTVDTLFDILPQHATAWKLGEPYAWLIDVLGPAGQTVFRLYYQDAASDSLLGLPPAMLGGRRVDVAILCVANAQNASPPAPDALVDSLRPRYVIASHWEYFFTPQTEELKRNPAADFGAFAESMRRHLPTDAEWSTPKPMAVYRFRAAP